MVLDLSSPSTPDHGSTDSFGSRRQGCLHPLRRHLLLRHLRLQTMTSSLPPSRCLTVLQVRLPGSDRCKQALPAHSPA